MKSGKENLSANFDFLLKETCAKIVLKNSDYPDKVRFYGCILYLNISIHGVHETVFCDNFGDNISPNYTHDQKPRSRRGFMRQNRNL